jgi:hypothetical protein
LRGDYVAPLFVGIAATVSVVAAALLMRSAKEEYDPRDHDSGFPRGDVGLNDARN